MTTLKTVIKKQKSFAFRKDIYLLGIDNDGTKYWLEAPSWDCGWYWGFGYVETYSNNINPSKAKDINSHQHIDSSFMGATEYYDYEKGCSRKGEYIDNIFNCPTFTATTFDEKTGWTLSELFKSFYQLKETAALLAIGSAHITTNPCADIIKNEDEVKRINQVVIPAITEKILELLTP